MENYSTIALALKQEPVKEHDRNYVFYTKSYGKLKLTAVGAAKIDSKLAGHLTAPSLAHIQFTVSRQPRLITALEDNAYLGIKKNAAALRAALLIGGLVNDFSFERQPEEEVWKLVSDALYFLEQNVSRFEEVADFTEIYFNARLLRILGLAPLLDSCIACGQKISDGFFSWERRSLACLAHRQKSDMPMTARQINFLRLLLDADFSDFSPVARIREILQEKEYLQEFLRKFTLIVKSDIM